MEQKFELKGPAAVIVAILVLGGVLVVKGPSGLMDMLKSGKSMILSDKVLNTKGKQEIRSEILIGYRQQFQNPLMEQLGDDPASKPEVATKLQSVIKVLDSLKIEELSARYRTRRDTGKRLELYIDVSYSMSPAPPDGKTNRTYAVDVDNHGRGSWHIKREE